MTPLYSLAPFPVSGFYSPAGLSWASFLRKVLNTWILASGSASGETKWKQSPLSCCGGSHTNPHWVGGLHQGSAKGLAYHVPDSILRLEHAPCMACCQASVNPQWPKAGRLTHISVQPTREWEEVGCPLGSTGFGAQMRLIVWLSEK